MHVIAFDGSFNFYTPKPKNMHNKLVGLPKLSRLGWKSMITLKKGIVPANEQFRAWPGIS